jgi:hypothetical protein
LSGLGGGECGGYPLPSCCSILVPTELSASVGNTVAAGPGRGWGRGPVPSPAETGPGWGVGSSVLMMVGAQTVAPVPTAYPPAPPAEVLLAAAAVVAAAGTADPNSAAVPLAERQTAGGGVVAEAWVG